MGPPQKQVRLPRYRKRLPFTFGLHADHQETAGFTTNLSGSGFAVQAQSVLPADALLFGTLHLPDGKLAPVEGRVAWCRHPEKALGLPGAMGIRILVADERFFQFVLSASRTPGTASG